MAREDTRSKRTRDDDEDEDEQPTRRSRGRTDDDDAPKGKRGRTDDDDEVSLDDEDAIETGLFASGPATIKEAVFDNYKYGDSGTAAPALIVVFERDGEQPYEQPYSIGSGWAIKNGKLIAKNGQTGLPKSCNAIRHFVKPYKAACEEAGVDPIPLKPSTIGELAGLSVVVERVEQEERNIRDDRGGRDRERGRARGDRDDDKKKGPRTILEIREILDGNAAGGAKKKKKTDDDDDEQPAKKGAKADAEDDDDEPEADEKPAKGVKGGKDTKPADLDEAAVEAVIAAVEAADGDPIKMGEPLEDALEAVLKGTKGAGAIIDLASSKKFLQTEQGWAFDGKVVTAAKKRKK